MALWPSPRTRTLQEDTQAVKTITWSERGKNLRSYSAYDGTLTDWNVMTGERSSHVVAPPSFRSSFSIGGDYLVMDRGTKDDWQLRIFTPRSNDVLRTINARESIGRRPPYDSPWFALSPDASRIAITGPAEVEIVSLRQGGAYGRLGRKLREAARYGEAELAFRKALEVDDRNPTAANNVAWWLATAPDANHRDAAKAVELARRTVDSSPDNPMFRNTLGVALYRAGEWKAAADSLSEVEAIAPGEYSSYNFFFLAMANRQLGQKDEASQLYHQSVEWMKANDPQDPELQRFRQEAAELLGIPFDDKSPP